MLQRYSCRRKVANLCKKFNPKIKILKTNDKVPNPGYSLSNEKLWHRF